MLYFRRKKHRYLLNRRLGGTRGNLDTEGKRKTSSPCQELKYESSDLQTVVYSLYWFDLSSMLDRVFRPVRLRIRRPVCWEKMDQGKRRVILLLFVSSCMLRNSILKEVIMAFMGYKLWWSFLWYVGYRATFCYSLTMASVALKQRANGDVNTGECGIYLKNEFTQRREKGIYACEMEGLGMQPLKYKAFPPRIQ